MDKRMQFEWRVFFYFVPENVKRECETLETPIRQLESATSKIAVHGP